jgi:hypothetical protein
MGMLNDYFTAPSDEDAALALDLPGGPGAPVESPPVRGMLFGSTPAATPGPSRFPTVPGYRIDPFIQIATLEALLTGTTYDAVRAARSGEQPVALSDDGDCVVLRLPDTLGAALADASDARLAEVAVPWSRTDELAGTDPGELHAFLVPLAAVARAGRARGEALYCWTAV